MIEFFFDCSGVRGLSSFHNIQPLAKEFDPRFRGGRSWSAAFQLVNPSVYASARRSGAAVKGEYMKRTRRLGATSAGLAIKMPPTCFQ